MTPSAEQTLTARWLLPGDGPPLEGGTITLAGGSIIAVEPRGRRRPDVDLGNVALLPGLVNAHTHLDLSGMRGKCPPTPDFVGWLRQVIAHRQATTPEQTQADIRAGLAECLRFGTTLVGDIASVGASWEALAESPVRAVVFYEVLGLSLERAQEADRIAAQWLATHPATSTCRPGISPHAPYSVRASLLSAMAELAQRFDAPLTIHLAESQEELELLHHQRGPFVAFLKERGVWDRDGLIASPGRVMEVCSSLVSHGLFVHGNYLAPSARIPRHSTVVFCPRTHAAFGHPPHPFRDFIARGTRVALGTDGLSSNPDLDLLAEARFISRRYPDFPGEQLLRLATLSGAEALGWADVTGSLTPGKAADLVTVPLPDDDLNDPFNLLFASSHPVQSVMIGGHWAWNAPAHGA